MISHTYLIENNVQNQNNTFQVVHSMRIIFLIITAENSSSLLIRKKNENSIEVRVINKFYLS